MQVKKRHAVSKALLLVLLIWTGILLTFPVQKGALADWIAEHGMEWLVGQGYRAAAIHQYTDSEREDLFFWKLVFGSDTTWSYLAEEKEDLEWRYKDGTKQMVMLCPGYGSKNSLWSGAAGDAICQNRLFAKSDEQIVALAEEEEETSVKILEENQASGKQVIGGSKQDEDVKGTGEDTGDVEENAVQAVADAKLSAGIIKNQQMIKKLKSSKSRAYLLKNFYITDSSTSIDNTVFDVGKLLSASLAIKKKNEPQILIIHTHGASEAFRDSRPGVKSDTIVGVGSKLASILEKKYNYNVIHDMTQYDMINGSIDRNKAYNQAAVGIRNALKKNPSIEVVIDLHRDGVGNKVQRTTVINGKRTAQVMFFNGLSRNSSGDIDYLYNPNLQSNLAFSLQLKLASMEQYADFAKPVYLKGYRYNLHMRKRSVLIELGNENNTLEEAKNAMGPLAGVLDSVLSGN